MRRWLLRRSRGAVLGLAIPALAWVVLPGCGGGEPTGDDAYSQKFEKPAGAPEGTGTLPDTASERREDIKKAQEAAAKKGSAKKS